MWQLPITIALIITVTVMIMYKTPPQYVAMTDDHTVINLPTLDKPYLDNGQLLNWTTNTVLGTFTLAPNNWQATLMGVKNNYSESIFTELILDLKDPNKSGILDAVNKKTLFATASRIGKPAIITQQGMINGRYTRVVEFVMEVKLESGSGRPRSVKMTVAVTVTRVDLTEHPLGLNITQLKMK